MWDFTNDTFMLRRIKNLKDKLKIVVALFREQQSVLEGANKIMAGSGHSPADGDSIPELNQKIEKVAQQINKMDPELSLAYENVSDFSNPLAKCLYVLSM